MSEQCIVLKPGADLRGFRRAVRFLIAGVVAPMSVVWAQGDAPGFFGDDETKRMSVPVPLPRPVSDLIETVVCHREPERFALLYQLVWRVLQGERELLHAHSDPLVFRLKRMEKEVRRDLHKMYAFLRFRQVKNDDGSERFVAWFEPDNFILAAAGTFFVDRFRSLKWSILTPLGSLHWDRTLLTEGPPALRENAPQADAFEEAWTGYFESTFNPARTNPNLMRRHMPRKYWRNLPETASIPGLIRSAQPRVTSMIEQELRMPIKRNPERAVALMVDQAPKSLAELNEIIGASGPLVPGAMRAVLGEGPAHPALAFVGEQPGDQEDIEGHPFVGPAGQLLTRAMEEAGIARDKTYITNAVKHFKFTRRGKRRIHEKPTAGEVKHYRWWLEKELEFVQPRRVVALGATAVLALAGKSLPIGKNRGPAQFGEWPGFITVHPSYLLRIPDASAKEEAYSEFVADLKRARMLSEEKGGSRRNEP